MLKTERLVLRQWRDEDFPPFAALNDDPRVMEFFTHHLTCEESNALAQRIRNHIDSKGWGFWAVEVPKVTPFIGFVGLAIPNFEADFTPCVEVGWRLSYPYCGKGYATEAAHAAIAYGFNELNLTEILSFTYRHNYRSRAVMEKIGMLHDGDFEHPKLPEAHPLRPHVLYRIKK